MKSRIQIALVLAFLLALAVTVPALAGGWAVITLDTLPGDVEANQPIEIGFMVRQHGVTPMTDLEPMITAFLEGSKESVTVIATEEGEVGHYVATLILPKSGEWQWGISAFTVNQPMPPLTVLEASVVAEPVVAPVVSEPVSTIPKPLPLFALGIGLVGVVTGLFALQRKTRWAVALLVVGLLISGFGISTAAAEAEQVSAETEKEVQVVEPEPSLSHDEQVQLGYELFIAKGCMMCHSHSKTNNIREFGADMGPAMTNYSASEEYLHLWLKDPLAAKSTATMPNLGLKKTEIEALIAFINDK
jgi:cytochrome c2